MFILIKYMLGIVYLSISLLYLKESYTSDFKTARKKRFVNGATSNWFLYVTMQTKEFYFN